MPEFPLKPYLNDVKQNDAIMHYTRDGDFTKSDLGADTAGLPKGITEGQRMTIKHVGDKV